MHSQSATAARAAAATWGYMSAYTVRLCMNYRPSDGPTYGDFRYIGDTDIIARFSGPTATRGCSC